MNRLDRLIAEAKADAQARARNADAPTVEEDDAYAAAYTAATGRPAGGANTSAAWDAMTDEERAALLDSPAYRE